ncbi:MAG: cation:proton antiporter [Phycisphaerales bacterium]|nr:cation:proton antiporter [Phycisphaerales bacterium]
MGMWHVLGDVVLLLGAALLAGLVFERIGLSAIVGYLVAGIILGPSVTGLIDGHGSEISHTAELGVALLLFTIGLEVTVDRLRAFGWLTAMIGSFQVVGTLAVAGLIAWFIGVPAGGALAIGAVAALSSTATVARILESRSELDSAHGRTVFGVLLIQDIATVPLLLLISLLGMGGSFGETAGSIAKLFGNGVALVAVAALLFVFLMPRLLSMTVLTRSRESAILLAVVACFTATWLANYLGLSPALGAFIAGLLLAGSPFAHQIRADVAPLKAILLTLFFASVGMLINISQLGTPTTIGLVIVCAIAIIFGKTVIMYIILRLLGRPDQVSWASGLCLAQIGEFSFVLGGAAVTSGLLNDEIGRQIIVVTFLTLLVAPVLVSHARPIGSRLTKGLAALGFAADVTPSTDRADHRWSDHVVVVGYGPAGRAVVHAVREAGRTPVVIEMNAVTVAAIQHDGIDAVVGVAQHREILEYVEIESAAALVVTVPDYRIATQVVAQARSMVPDLHILSRSRHAKYVQVLRSAGADDIADEEVEVGERLVERLQLWSAEDARLDTDKLEGDT